ncbi:unnamed protein product [Urochloa decumbens]|uniref:Uncharacterized protein n=1 Tax=Urochloa decumbens TaxID=240449 RepID=A0ABC8YGJ9_9POAL
MSPEAAAAGDGEPWRSASSIVADTAMGYHVLRIDAYSLTKCAPTGKCLKSCPFTIGGHRWRLRYYPNGESAESAEFISMYLSIEDAVPKGVSVKTQFQFRFVDEAPPELPVTSDEVRIFRRRGRWGHPWFIEREELEKSEHLVADSFAIRCDLVVIKEFRAQEDTAPAPATCFVPVPPPSDLCRHLGDLLVTGKGADVVFEVGGETFAAHRCVLAARSPVFSAELLGDAMTKESGATAVIIRVDDMEPQVFEALLYFVYNDDLLPETEKERERRISISMCQHVLVAADRYGLERLKLMCEEELCGYIDVGTVATVLTLADQHHCKGLKKACFGFLGSPANLREVMATDEFDHLSKSCPSIMKELIAMLGT